jgi:putative transposase
MSNNGHPHPTHPRCFFQDQSSARSTQGPQDAGPTQQRIWHPCPDDHRLETTSTRWYAYPIRVGSQQTGHLLRATRADRSAFVSANWSTKGRKRLSQKKITNELVGDQRRLVEITHAQLSISRQCELFGIPRSSYYYQPVEESAENLALMERIDKLFTARPELGLRRMHQEITSDKNPVNIKRVHRLMRLMGLEAVYQKPNLSKPAEGHRIYPYLLRGVVIDGPDHVWSTDITYLPMANGFLYLCVVIDWYTRFILGWRLSNTLLTDFCIGALLDAFEQWGQPRVFNSDQGSQFTSNDFLKVLQERPIAISMDSKGRALDNIFVERFWRTLKYEHVYLRAYSDGLSLLAGLTEYIRFYNYERKHQSLGYQTPAQWYIDRIEKGKKSTILDSASTSLT